MIPSQTRSMNNGRRHHHRTRGGLFIVPKWTVYATLSIFFFFGTQFGIGWNARTSDADLMKPGVSSSNHDLSNTNHVESRAGKALHQSQETVLVTGGLGFIGSHIVEDLIIHGYSVIIYDNMSSGRNFNKQATSILLRDVKIVDDYSFIRQKVDYVVHLAAAVSITESIQHPEKYELNNVEGSRLLLDWAKNHGVKQFIAASSASCYGSDVTLSSHPMQEEFATGGIDPFSQSKFKMEQLMEQYSNTYSLPTIALRLFNVYGPRDTSASSGVISRFMEQLSDKNISISGTGDQYRDFVYVADVARAIRLAMQLTSRSFDVFNICTGVNTTVNALAQTILDVSASSANIVYESSGPDAIIASLVGNPEKANDLLGFNATYSLSQGLKETYSWFTENENEII